MKDRTLLIIALIAGIASGILFGVSIYTMSNPDYRNSGGFKYIDLPEEISKEDAGNILKINKVNDTLFLEYYRP